MTTQDFLSDLWGRYALTYKNEGVFKSHAPDSTPRASTTLTPQSSNSEKSTGAYRSPVQIIQILPPMIPPKYRERNQMNPLDQKEKNIAMERMESADPRINKTGMHLKTGDRLQNMDIQIPQFNYAGIIGVVGILLGVVAIVWLARGKRNA